MDPQRGHFALPAPHEPIKKRRILVRRLPLTGGAWSMASRTPTPVTAACHRNRASPQRRVPEGSASDPLARPPRFVSRRHNPGVGLDEHEQTAIGRGELIEVKDSSCDILIRLGHGAIRVDGIRAGVAVETSNLPVHAL